MITPGLGVDTDELGAVASRVRSEVDGVRVDDLVSMISAADSFGHDGLYAAVNALSVVAQQAVTTLRGTAEALAAGVSSAADAYLHQEDAAIHLLSGAPAQPGPAGYAPEGVR